MHQEQLAECSSFHTSIEKRTDKMEQKLEQIEGKVEKVKDSVGELKVYILCSAISGLVILLGVAMYYGGDKKQTEINTKDIQEIKKNVYIFDRSKVIATSRDDIDL